MRYSNTVELVQQAGTKYRKDMVRFLGGDRCIILFSIKTKIFLHFYQGHFFLAGCFYKTAEKSAFILLILLLFMFAFLSYN